MAAVRVMGYNIPNGGMMKEIVAVESRNQNDARTLFKEWLNAHPDIMRTVAMEDVVLEVVRAEGGTLFRYVVRYDETEPPSTPAMRREAAQAPFDKKLQRVGELIALANKEPTPVVEKNRKS